MSDILAFLSKFGATAAADPSYPYLPTIALLSDRYFVIGNGASAKTIESWTLSYGKTILLSGQGYDLVAAASNRLFLGNKTGTNGNPSVSLRDLSGSAISTFDIRGVGTSGSIHLIQTIKTLTADGTYVYVHGTGDWMYGGSNLVNIVHKYDLTGAFIAEYGFNDDLVEIFVYGGNVYGYSSANSISVRDFSGSIAHQITAADSNGTVAVSSIVANTEGIFVAYPVTGYYQGILCYDFGFNLVQTYKSSSTYSHPPGQTNTKLGAYSGQIVAVFG